MKYSINSLIILQVFPQKYVPINLENKPDNPKFASMNLYDYIVCTTTNTNCLYLLMTKAYYKCSFISKTRLFSFQWKTWSEIFGGSRSGAGSYVVTYFVYMLWAIVFAMLAALFVRVFAPYACGSGIPEVSAPLLKEAGWSTNLSSDLP